MVFVPNNRSSTKIEVGTRLVLEQDVKIPEGTVLKGSVIEVKEILFEGKYLCVDVDSKVTLNVFANTRFKTYYRQPADKFNAPSR